MLEQAYDRSESSALHDAQEKRKKLLKCAALEMWLILLSVVNAAIFNNMRICASIFGCLTGIIAIGYSAGYKFKTDEIKELEKYDIYLLMREALEKNIENPNLFNGVKNQQEVLNINTLDDYSLSDIKTVQSNLNRIKILKKI